MDGNIEPEFNPVMDADEPLQPFDVHENGERAGLLKLLAAFGVLLALAFIVLKLYQPGTRARTDPPLITADNTPFKVVPEDRGGAQTPDQDKEVFEVMGGAEPSTDVVTLPAPEVPITVPSREPANPPASEPEQATPAPTPAPAQQRPAQQRPAPNRPRPGTNPVTEGPSPTPAPPPVRPAPEPAPPTPTPSSGGSDWVVQVASLRTQAEADATFARIKAANTAILAPYGSDIVRVDLGEKGIYYRARVDGFGNKAEAAAACDRLKAAGQSCFVAKR